MQLIKKTKKKILIKMAIYLYKFLDKVTNLLDK